MIAWLWEAWSAGRNSGPADCEVGEGTLVGCQIPVGGSVHRGQQRGRYGTASQRWDLPGGEEGQGGVDGELHAAHGARIGQRGGQGVEIQAEAGDVNQVAVGVDAEPGAVGVLELVAGAAPLAMRVKG